MRDRNKLIEKYIKINPAYEDYFVWFTKKYIISVLGKTSDLSDLFALREVPAFSFCEEFKNETDLLQEKYLFYLLTLINEAGTEEWSIKFSHLVKTAYLEKIVDLWNDEYKNKARYPDSAIQKKYLASLKLLETCLIRQIEFYARNPHIEQAVQKTEKFYQKAVELNSENSEKLKNLREKVIYPGYAAKNARGIKRAAEFSAEHPVYKKPKLNHSSAFLGPKISRLN